MSDLDVERAKRRRLAPLHSFGDEPDPRFTLANERTFLAWNRTALALIGAGLAVSQFLDDFALPGGNAWLAVPLTALGGVLAVASYFRWYRIERALREQAPLPLARIPAVLGPAIALVAVAAVVLVLLP